MAEGLSLFLPFVPLLAGLAKKNKILWILRASVVSHLHVFRGIL